jgi:hypothetical protein
LYFRWTSPSSDFDGILNYIQTTLRGHDWPESEKVHYSNCPNIFRHKIIAVNPKELRKQGFTVSLLEQRAGDLILTFPRALHQGYNVGRNHATSVNYFHSSYYINFLEALICTELEHGLIIDQVTRDAITKRAKCHLAKSRPPPQVLNEKIKTPSSALKRRKREPGAGGVLGKKTSSTTRYSDP